MSVPYRRASCDARFWFCASRLYRRLPALALLLALCGALPAAAQNTYAFRRHDTAIISGGSATGTPPDSPTKRIDPNVPTSPFAGVGSLYTYGDVSTGTVLDSYHILIAAHSVTDPNNGQVNITPNNVGFILNTNGSGNLQYHGTAIAVDPEFKGFNNRNYYGNADPYGDVAVVTLDNPIPDSVPRYALYDGPISARNTLITMVGYGQGGYGDSGYDPNAPASFGIKRVGYNAMDAFEDTSGNLTDVYDPTTQRIFLSDFGSQDPSTHLLNGPILPNDKEATLGGGDSGSPSFVLVNGAYQIAGVNTFTTQFVDNNGITHAAAPLFGSGFGGQLISAYAPFIRAHTSAIPEAGTVVTLGLGLLALGGTFLARARAALRPSTQPE